MNIMERLGLARPKIERIKEIEIIDAPTRSIRSETLRFAGDRGALGFTDDELILHLDQPNVARTTLLTPRIKLVREGLLVEAGAGRNLRGNKVKVYKSVAFVEGPARVPEKRLTYMQLRRQLTTAQLELSSLRAQRDAFIRASVASDETKALYIGEFKFNHEFKHQDGTDDFMDITVPWTVTKEIMAAITNRAWAIIKEGK